MSTLFLKPAAQLTWDDVESFCDERTPENAILDYKQDFPKELEKTVAAMANTYGGMILIGVQEDSENKPVLPLRGIKFERGISERVMGIVISNIRPPIMPEIAVCLDLAGEKAIVVIRVPESYGTPHAIANNTQPYLRTGDRNQPETLASMDKIEWLVDRRKKSEQFRESLYKGAQARLRVLQQWDMEEVRARGENAPEGSWAWLSLSLCPVFPKESFRDPPEMNEIYDNIKVRDYPGSGTFPKPEKGFGRIVQDGVILHEFGKRVFHTELNCYGLYYFTQGLSWERSKSEELQQIQAEEIFARLDQFIESAIAYFEQLNHWGFLQFRMDLEDISNSILSRKTWFHFDDPQRSPDSHVQYSERVLSSALRHEKSRMILQAARRIAWAFGWDLNEEALNVYYKKTKGKTVV